MTLPNKAFALNIRFVLKDDRGHVKVLLNIKNRPNQTYLSLSGQSFSIHAELDMRKQVKGLQLCYTFVQSFWSLLLMWRYLVLPQFPCVSQSESKVIISNG